MSIEPTKINSVLRRKSYFIFLFLNLLLATCLRIVLVQLMQRHHALLFCDKEHGTVNPENVLRQHARVNLDDRADYEQEKS